MAYFKAIIYGDNLELFNYEKNPVPPRHATRRLKKRVELSNLVEGVEPPNVLQIKKRQDSVRHAVLAFKRLILANLAGCLPPLFFTFTYSENQTNLGIAYKDFEAFIKRMRYKFGQDFSYIAVPEFQKRGSVHFHTLFWGLPSDLCKTERRTRLVASLWRKGFIDVIETDGNDKLSSYLAKYMSKSYADQRLYAKKAYRCSRNIVRPVVESPLAGSWFLRDVYPQYFIDPPCVDKEFLTQWCGKGRFRLYKQNK